MPQRIAACLALTVFAICLMVGISAENSFRTTLGRALMAMVVTLLVGLVVGWMAQKMLEENLLAEQEKLKNLGEKPREDDR